MTKKYKSKTPKIVNKTMRTAMRGVVRDAKRGESQQRKRAKKDHNGEGRA